MAVLTLALGALLAATHVAAVPTLLPYDPGMCNNQSCVVANIAGNSGVPVSTDPADYPVGDTYQGDCCVITLNPSVAPLAYMFNPKLKQCSPMYQKRTVDQIDAREQFNAGEMLMLRHIAEARAAMSDEEYEAMQVEAGALEKRACSPKILIFSKGTFEPGMLGVTVGPMLQKALKKYSGWSVQGVTYMNSIQGDYCLGLPGGIIVKQQLQSVAASCPQSKIVVAGYSEGALVTRNGVGNSTAQRRVSGVVTFGDPFEGSPIKGYKGPIQVYCAKGDGVCKGQFDITAAHLSYGGDINGAAAIIEQMATT